uniref:Secreted protein n=1 Tax=Lutzomyia longipalpis TaxID=7200 RepID=A0A1B0CAJ6_LUTLO
MQKVLVFLLFCVIFIRVSLAYPYQQNPYYNSPNNPYPVNGGYNQGGLQQSNSFAKPYEQNQNLQNPYNANGGYNQKGMQNTNNYAGLYDPNCNTQNPQNQYHANGGYAQSNMPRRSCKAWITYNRDYIGRNCGYIQQYWTPS